MVEVGILDLNSLVVDWSEVTQEECEKADWLYSAVLRPLIVYGGEVALGRHEFKRVSYERSGAFEHIVIRVSYEVGREQSRLAALALVRAGWVKATAWPCGSHEIAISYHLSYVWPEVKG